MCFGNLKSHVYDMSAVSHEIAELAVLIAIRVDVAPVELYAHAVSAGFYRNSELGQRNCTAVISCYRGSCAVLSALVA